jgi:hypothetical protein
MSKKPSDQFIKPDGQAHSARRQDRRAYERILPHLKSGRQWRKFRKDVQREAKARIVAIRDEQPPISMEPVPVVPPVE